jgi:hypothetical protein
MKKLLLLLSSWVLAVSALAQYAGDYDPFTYSPGNLIGNGSWVDGAGGSGVSAGPQIGSDNLSYSGLQTSGGTGANFGAGNENAMFTLSGGGTGTWGGSPPMSVYFSYELRLSSAPTTGPIHRARPKNRRPHRLTRRRSGGGGQWVGDRFLYWHPEGRAERE